MSNYKNVNRVLIGSGTNSGTITSIPGIQKGDIVVFNEAGVAVNTNAAGAALPKHEKIIIASGIGAGQAILSSPIQGNTVSKYEGATSRDPLERIVSLGYDGATVGSGLSLDAGSNYRLRVLVKDEYRIHGQRSTFGDIDYSHPIGATAFDAATSIVKLYNQASFGNGFLKNIVNIDRIVSATASQADNGFSWVKGISAITCDTAATHGGGTPFAVGDVIRFGQTATSPVYNITAVNGLVLTLDSPIYEVTNSATNVDLHQLSSITEVGIKLDGVAQDALLEGYDEYEWINFDAAFSEAGDGVGSTLAKFTELQALDPGQGYYKQVRDREEAAKGYLGDTSKRRFHDKRIPSAVDGSVNKFDSVIITHADIQGGDFQGTYSAPLKTEIYMPASSPQTSNAGDELVHILNGIYGASGLGFADISF